MAKESVHKKLERVRPPRVHVTYDVEVGDAIEVKELPFVMGVLADLSGQPTEALPKLKDRRFVEITPDNFDGVLESFKPHLSLEVDNKLSDESDAGKLKVDLDFKSLDDFDPAMSQRTSSRCANYLNSAKSLEICAALCRATTSWTIF